MRKKTIAILVLGGLIASCSDFVDIESPTTVRQDSYFKSVSDFTAAVNGMYNGLRGYYSSFYLLAEIPSDNAQINGYTLAQGPLDQLNWLPSTAEIQNQWVNSYSIIARCNTILERIGQFDMDPGLKKQYQGEARFTRALVYFNLVRFFGDVPLVLKSIESEEEAYTFLRTPVQDVYSQIQSDLLFAADNLPGKYDSNNIGRVTSGAALSLLGKVYVTKGEFDQALPVLNQVVTSNLYKLLPDYEKVFDVGNKNNEEIIFDVQYLGGAGFGEGSNFSIAFAPAGSGTEITSGGSPGSANSGTLDLYNAFEAGDLRKKVSIAFWPSPDSLYYTLKFKDRPIAANEGKSNWPVIRYADILLLLSETRNETGDVAGALNSLNQVRARAGLPVLNDAGQAELRQAIQRERRVELCFEGHRWFDLLRTGTMLSTMRSYKEKYLKYGGYLVVNYDITDNKVLFPIPFREVSVNPGLVQNPGYR